MNNDIQGRLEEQKSSNHFKQIKTEFKKFYAFKNHAKGIKPDEYDFEFELTFFPFLRSKEDQKRILNHKTLKGNC